MNLTQLKYFEAVCMFENVSDAAKYVHIAQPSLSNAIKELENEFGVALFRRHRHGMTLTQEGKILREMSNELLTKAEQTVNIMKDIGNKRKNIRLGIPPMIGSVILPQIYRDFICTAENFTVNITEGGRQELCDKLLNDELDLVFLPHNRPFSKDISSVPVARLEIVCCTAVGNPLAKENIVTPEILKNTSLVLFENSFFQTEEIKKWFAHKGITPNILLQTDQLSTMHNILANDIAVGFMFRKFAEGIHDLTAIPMHEPIYADISLAWKSETYFFNNMRMFKEYILNNNPFSKQ